MPYTPDLGGNVLLKFSPSYTPPNGATVVLEFGGAQQCQPSGFGGLAFGSHVVLPAISPAWIGPGLFGSHFIGVGATIIGADGWLSEVFGSTVFARGVRPAGFDAALFGGNAIKGRNELLPSGVASGEAFGAHSIDIVLAIQPAGIYEGAWGVPSLARNINPSGLAPPGFGYHTIYLRTRHLSPTWFQGWGTAASQFGFGLYGAGWVSHLDRTLSTSGIFQEAFGNLNSAGGLRYIDQAGRGVSPPGFGTQFIAYRERRVYPTGIIKGLVGAAMFGFHRSIEHVGWDSSVIWTATVRDNRQLAEPDGFIATQWGVPFVDRSPRHISPLGIYDDGQYPHGAWGRAEVYNRTQIVTQLFDDQNTDYQGGFGSPVHTKVENVNRAIGAVGERMDRVSIGARVENAAVPISPIGWDSQVLYFGLGLHPPGTGFIAHRDREIVAPGHNDPIVGYFGQAQVAKTPQIDPPGIASRLAFGMAAIENTRRWRRIETMGETHEWGLPRVEYLHRNVAPAGLDAYGFGIPQIENWLRYIYPRSFAPEMQFGHSYWEIHWNLVFTHGQSYGSMGTEHRVRNVTPEIAPYGYDMSEWGRNAIRTQWRIVAPESWRDTQWGRTDIGPRTKTIAPRGFTQERVSQFLNIYNDTPDPPPTRLLLPTSWNSAIYGFPTLRWNTLYASGAVMTLWGTPTVRANSIYPVGFWEDTKIGGQFGVARINATQWIRLTEEQRRNGLDGAFGFGDEERFPARVDPYTIYCTFDVTLQVRQNHPSKEWELMDAEYEPGHDASRPFFGSPSISNKNRRIDQHSSSSFLRWGMTQIDLKHRIVRAQGWRSQKFGFPLVTHGGEINMDLFNQGLSSTLEFGTPSLSIPAGTLHIRPPGRLSQEMGDGNNVSFMNRDVAHGGWDSSKFGSGYVGPPNFRYMQGFIDTTWGPKTFIGYRIRSVNAEGWVDEAWGPDIDSFDSRMRITRQNRIGPAGINSQAIGTPTAWRYRRDILGVGLSDTSIVPGPTVKRQSIIALGGYGWDSQEFGDVWRVTPGRVDNRGWIDGAFGVHRFSRTAPQSGWLDEAFGSPSVGDVVFPEGFEATVWGSNVLTGDGLEFTCGQLPRALVAHGFDAAAFGTQGVAHG